MVRLGLVIRSKRGAVVNRCRMLFIKLVIASIFLYGCSQNVKPDFPEDLETVSDIAPVVIQTQELKKKPFYLAHSGEEVKQVAKLLYGENSSVEQLYEDNPQLKGKSKITEDTEVYFDFDQLNLDVDKLDEGIIRRYGKDLAPRLKFNDSGKVKVEYQVTETTDAWQLSQLLLKDRERWRELYLLNISKLESPDKIPNDIKISYFVERTVVEEQKAKPEETKEVKFEIPVEESKPVTLEERIALATGEKMPEKKPEYEQADLVQSHGDQQDDESSEPLKNSDMSQTSANLPDSLKSHVDNPRPFALTKNEMLTYRQDLSNALLAFRDQDPTVRRREYHPKKGEALVKIAKKVCGHESYTNELYLINWQKINDDFTVRDGETVTYYGPRWVNPRRLTKQLLEKYPQRLTRKIREQREVNEGKTLAQWTTKAGETLQSISHDLYQTTRYWPEIYLLNKEKIRNYDTLEKDVAIDYYPEK